MTLLCYCCSGDIFSDCCEPLLTGIKRAENAEALMRSRYSAYASKQYQYVYDTYAKDYRIGFSVSDLSNNDQKTNWVKLNIINTTQVEKDASVEFQAFYSIDKQFYILHELSDFVLEDNRWFYTKGELIENGSRFIPKRNDLCLCGSQLKFKKCCGQ